MVQTYLLENQLIKRKKDEILTLFGNLSYTARRVVR